MCSWKCLIIRFPAWLQPLRAHTVAARCWPNSPGRPGRSAGAVGLCWRDGRPVGSVATAVDSVSPRISSLLRAGLGSRGSALGSPRPLSKSHLFSPRLRPNDYRWPQGRGWGVKTPGGKPFALATWDCGIISTAAIRSRRRQQEVGRLVRKNRTSVDSDSVIRCCPWLSLSRHQVRPTALLQSHRGRQSHRCDRDHSPRCARGKHTEGGRLPQEKPGWRCGRMGLRTLPRPGDNHSLSA